jgi:acetyl-CoA C-acetyltransferase
MHHGHPTWILPAPRTAFTRVDGPFKHRDAVALSVPVARAMMDQVVRGRPDFAVWGTVAPNLAWSNLAREVLLDAQVDPSIPAFSTIMQCSTSAMGAIEAAGMLGHGGRHLAMCGGVESMSRVQIGISQGLSDWLRRLTQARTMGDRLKLMATLAPKDVSLYIPSVSNRSTGKSMGQHTEETAKEWAIAREPQDELALASHRGAIEGWERGFFDDLVIEVDGTKKDAFPRSDTSLERLAKLKPAFDRRSGLGTLTAGNSSPLTDGAAGVWIADDEGVGRLKADLPKVQFVDYELAAVDIYREGLLMAPAYAIPRLLHRHGLRYGDIDVWEIHEAFAAQVLFTIKAITTENFLSQQVGIDPQGGRTFGEFPRERVNRYGGSIAIGHPFGATGARILSQAAKLLSTRPSGSYGVVSICADGGVGTVMLLRTP